MESNDNDNKSNVIRRTIHLRDRVNDVVQPNGGATVTCDYNKNTRVLDFAISLCSKKDSFCKQKGRIISEGRLSNWLGNDTFQHHKFVYSVTVPENVRFLTIIDETVGKFVSGNDKFANEVMDNTEYCNLKDFKKFSESSINFQRKQVVENAVESAKTFPTDY